MKATIADVLRVPDAGPEWRSLRSAVALSRGGLALFVVCCVIVIATNRWPRSLSETGVAIVGASAFGAGLVGIVAAVSGGFWKNASRCPRCGMRFFLRPGRWGGVYQNSWARRCLNCQLPRWSAALESQREPSNVR